MTVRHARPEGAFRDPLNRKIQQKRDKVSHPQAGGGDDVVPGGRDTRGDHVFYPAGIAPARHLHPGDHRADIFAQHLGAPARKQRRAPHPFPTLAGGSLEQHRKPHPRRAGGDPDALRLRHRYRLHVHRGERKDRRGDEFPAQGPGASPRDQGFGHRPAGVQSQPHAQGRPPLRGYGQREIPRTCRILPPT